MCLKYECECAGSLVLKLGMAVSLASLMIHLAHSQHTVSTLSAHSQHTLNTLSAHYQHTLNVNPLAVW